MALTLTRTKRNGGFEGMRKRIERMPAGVVVGLLRDCKPYAERPGRTPAQAGYYNSYHEHNPNRPFLKKFVDENRSFIARGLKAVIDEGWRSVRGGRLRLAELGKASVVKVKKIITDWTTPKNAEYTIHKKGFDDPLIETGHMRDSVSYRVED